MVCPCRPSPCARTASCRRKVIRPTRAARRWRRRPWPGWDHSCRSTLASRHGPPPRRVLHLPRRLRGAYGAAVPVSPWLGAALGPRESTSDQGARPGDSAQSRRGAASPHPPAGGGSMPGWHRAAVGGDAICPGQRSNDGCVPRGTRGWGVVIWASGLRERCAGGSFDPCSRRVRRPWSIGGGAQRRDGRRAGIGVRIGGFSGGVWVVQIAAGL
jgi:hypothetical protein